MFNQPASEAGLLNKRLMLCSSFRCDQTYNYEIYHFGHTLLCYLSQTWMFNEPASEQATETGLSLLWMLRRNKLVRLYLESLFAGRTG
jgi:hypothetical protein